MKKTLALVIVGASLSLGGCSQYGSPHDKVVEGALIGGAVGGAVGAVATGGNAGGFIVGAGIGAAAGAAIASHYY